MSSIIIRRVMVAMPLTRRQKLDCMVAFCALDCDLSYPEKIMRL